MYPIMLQLLQVGRGSFNNKPLRYRGSLWIVAPEIEYPEVVRRIVCYRLQRLIQSVKGSLPLHIYKIWLIVAWVLLNEPMIVIDDYHFCRHWLASWTMKRLGIGQIPLTKRQKCFYVSSWYILYGSWEQPFAVAESSPLHFFHPGFTFHGVWTSLRLPG
jgi:hypothetical protein